ncbi:flagellar basal body rod protein FlgC [Ferrimonas sediminicola]|uniref:Flagellar basal-body rod protein FlgC n=1 Tax=Ferrimonas sediminicola TaxID=2569538 RepID=A0A4U1BB51_9GAMM|nr:flagellar basal body rod protein FlgC [Ferrimonas sediminicola]TKB47792.1 flagellar basal body rod protein FlgC [Ferrimonas sediminicola]
MSFNRIYDIAGSSLSAQTQRLNTVASNLANADAAAPSADQAYRAVKPVFRAVFDQINAVPSAKVEVAAVVQTDAPVEMRYEPNHPYANGDGFVAYSNVDAVAEMADMMSATQSFEASVNIMNRARSMQQGLLQLGSK